MTTDQSRCLGEVFEYLSPVFQNRHSLYLPLFSPSLSLHFLLGIESRALMLYEPSNSGLHPPLQTYMWPNLCHAHMWIVNCQPLYPALSSKQPRHSSPGVHGTRIWKNRMLNGIKMTSWARHHGVCLGFQHSEGWYRRTDTFKASLSYPLRSVSKNRGGESHQHVSETVRCWFL